MTLLVYLLTEFFRINKILLASFIISLLVFLHCFYIVGMNREVLTEVMAKRLFPKHTISQELQDLTDDR